MHLGTMDGARGFLRPQTALHLRHVAAIGAQADEIVRANECVAAPAQRVEVQRTVKMPRPIRLEG
jgi:hypothetical protein